MPTMSDPNSKQNQLPITQKQLFWLIVADLVITMLLVIGLVYWIQASDNAPSDQLQKSLQTQIDNVKTRLDGLQTETVNEAAEKPVHE